MPRCCRSGEKVASLVQHQSVNAWLASRGLRLCCATTERGGEGGRQQEAAAAAAFTATIASSSGAASLGPRTAAVAVTPHIIHGGVLDQSLWWVNKPVFSFTEVLYSLQQPTLADGITHRVHSARGIEGICDSLGRRDGCLHQDCKGWGKLFTSIESRGQYPP